MELYIQLENGQPINHPIFGDNLRQVIPDFDKNNLPSEYAVFQRVQFEESGLPALDHFEVAEVSYQWVEGIVKDVWSVRSMTNEARSEKIEIHRIQLENSLQALKQESANELQNATLDNERAIWQTYLDRLNSFTYENPVLAMLPFPPKRNQDGQLFSSNIGVTRV